MSQNEDAPTNETLPCAESATQCNTTVVCDDGTCTKENCNKANCKIGMAPIPEESSEQAAAQLQQLEKDIREGAARIELAAQQQQAMEEGENNVFNDPKKRGQINLLEVDVNDPNTALNVIVGFLGVAQKRGAFAINESAKIYECINFFS